MSKEILVTVINFTEEILKNMKEGEILQFKKEPVPLNWHMIGAYKDGNFVGRISHVASTTIDNTLSDDEIYDDVSDIFEGQIVDLNGVNIPDFARVVKIITE